MKNKLIGIFRFILGSLGVAGAIYILVTTVALSRDNQDSLNEIADKLNTMDQQVKVNTKAIKNKPTVHQRHTNIIQQWMGSTLK